MCVNCVRYSFYMAASSYIFTCAEDYESTDPSVSSATVFCDSYDSFSTFDVTAVLECSIPPTTTSACGECLGATCDDWWATELIACYELEDL